GRSAGDATDLLAIADDHRIAVTRDHAILHFETGENAAHSAFLLRQQSTASKELAFARLTNPPKISFPDRGRVVNFVAIETHGGFEPQGIAGAQAAGEKSFGFPGV